jgi:hypothetical protein
MRRSPVGRGQRIRAAEGHRTAAARQSAGSPIRAAEIFKNRLDVGDFYRQRLARGGVATSSFLRFRELWPSADEVERTS